MDLAFRKNKHVSDEPGPGDVAEPTDEATLIEQRRKRREAIKAKHRGQASPLIVQALALDKVVSKSEQMSAGNMTEAVNESKCRSRQEINLYANSHFRESCPNIPP